MQANKKIKLDLIQFNLNFIYNIFFKLIFVQNKFVTDADFETNYFTGQKQHGKSIQSRSDERVITMLVGEIKLLAVQDILSRSRNV